MNLKSPRQSHSSGGRLSAAKVILLCLVLTGAGLNLSCSQSSPKRGLFREVRTIAGTSQEANAARFGDPFGIAVASDRTIYLSDGEAGRIWRLDAEGSAKVIAENLDTPSGIALDPDGTLVVADTGSHTIWRVDPQSGRVSTIAGVPNHSGFMDGVGADALFNGPIGVTVGSDRTIYVADTYNDRIRAIDSGGSVRTIAGGPEPGFADATLGAEARFDTPCGIAWDVDGALIVADTGNQRLRRITPDGAVRTIAGNGERLTLNGPPLAASFNEPVAVTIDQDGTIYVADAGGSNIRACQFGLWAEVTTLAGRGGAGLSDGVLNNARFSRPSGIAAAPDGGLVVADAGNKLVRAVTREGTERGVELSSETIEALRPNAAQFRAQAPPRWPYDPPDRPREIAATFGEIRGEIGNEEEARFHNGLDIPGAYGETVRLVRGEHVLRPLAVDDVGEARERIRFPSLGYIHLRVGRDKDDRAFADERFIMRRDGEGAVTGVRVRRGARFVAGEALGTLNNQYHVHLLAGPVGAEFNALAALELPGIRDTVAPVIEKDGVWLFDRAGHEFVQSSGTKGGGTAKAKEEPPTVHGDVRVVVRAYDQMDGNAARRRLGLYRLGYQVLKSDGTPADGFAETLWTISFETLPDEAGAAAIAYAPGSKAGATGETVFAYIVTDFVRDRTAREDFWHTGGLPEGAYILRVFATDFFGNRTTRDLAVRVVSEATIAAP